MALLRPNEWSARPPLASIKPEQEWWMVRGNAGGPLLKDRAFFFANGTDLRAPKYPNLLATGE